MQSLVNVMCCNALACVCRRVSMDAATAGRGIRRRATSRAIAKRTAPPPSRRGSARPAASCTCPCRRSPCTWGPTRRAVGAPCAGRDSPGRGSCRGTSGRTRVSANNPSDRADSAQIIHPQVLVERRAGGGLYRNRSTLSALSGMCQSRRALVFLRKDFVKGCARKSNYYSLDF